MPTIVIIIGAALVLGAVIIVIASLCLSSNRWHWCPRCENYHSELGTMKCYPDKGAVVGNEVCRECQKKG